MQRAAAAGVSPQAGAAVSRPAGHNTLQLLLLEPLHARLARQPHMQAAEAVSPPARLFLPSHGSIIFIGVDTDSPCAQQ